MTQDVLDTVKIDVFLTSGESKYMTRHGRKKQTQETVRYMIDKVDTYNL